MPEMNKYYKLTMYLVGGQKVKPLYITKEELARITPECWAGKKVPSRISGIRAEPLVVQACVYYDPSQVVGIDVEDASLIEFEVSAEDVAELARTGKTARAGAEL